MIAEIIPELYDAVGNPTSHPISRKQKRRFESTYPIARFLSEPLKVRCKDLSDIQKFLRDCKYVSDKDKFDRKDYWSPPEEFEKTKKGDCDCFAMWTWRQLLEMGYKARFVLGQAGKFGDCHAWVTFEKDGKFYILEPQSAVIGEKLPRLSFAKYIPTNSVEWDGKNLNYYTHEKKPLSFSSILKNSKLLFEYLSFWTYFWLRLICIFILIPYFIPRNYIRNKLRKTKSVVK